MEVQPNLFDYNESSAFELSHGSVTDSESLMHPGWLRGLLKIKGIGPAKALKISKKFHTHSNLMESLDSEFLINIGIPGELLKSLEFLDPEMPDSVRVVSYFDDDYPEKFRELKDAPPIIWVKGTLPKSKSLTIVGTREPSDWGRLVSETAGRICAENSINTVSGLAFGIDAAAHQGSLANNGTTTAILGSGIDVPTPKQNAPMIQAILDRGGCVISEVEPGTLPSAMTLVSRNRLQSALGDALLMVECGIPSGTLHTVRFAFNLNRIIAVPIPTDDNFHSHNEANRVLTDEKEFDFSIIGLSHKLSQKRKVKRFADVVIKNIEELETFIQGV